MNIFISFRSEILKTKCTASYYLTLVAAGFIPFIFLLNICISGMPQDLIKDPLNAIFREGFQITGFAIFPMFVILIGTLLPQIEYRNNTWKQVLASPQTKANVFMAKFLNIHLLILVFLLANHLFTFLVAVVAHLIAPALHVLDQPLDGYALLIRSVNAYITLLAVSSIQFWMGLRFKNFIVPVGIGLACWFAGSLIVLESHSPYAKYFPYSFHIFSNFPEYKSQLTKIEWTSLGYAILFLVIGFIDFRRRRMSA
jgi:hypothetical protein